MDFADWLKQKGQTYSDARRHILAADDVVGGWRVLAYLAYGGTAEVYRVERDGVVAALKIARDPDQPHIAERFQREADLLRALSSPYFARFHGAGIQDGRPYLVTELLQPLDLPTDDAEVAALTTHLAAALAELHRHRHVHRDVKPTNVLTRDGKTPVLVDLGYAKPFSEQMLPQQEEQLSIDQNRVVGLGTPGYAAPEQFTGEDLTPAADIHALGVLINDCFGGHPPKDWLPLVRRATSSLTTQRYASMNEFSRAIRWRHLRHRLALLPILGAAVLALAFLVRTGIVVTTSQIEAACSQVFVDATAPAGGDGSRKRPFNTVTNALQHVPWFGTVTVAPGTYLAAVSLDEKCVTLRSSHGPDQTVLRVPTNEAMAAVYIGDHGEGSTLDGFTLTGGNGLAVAGDKSHALVDRLGGGLFCQCSATIRNCRIVGNGRRGTRGRDHADTPYLGGGVYIGGGNVTMADCLVASNCAWYCGGGLCVAGTNAALQLEHCQVLDNFAEGRRGAVGGLALANHGTAVVTECRFAGNTGAEFGAVTGESPKGTGLVVKQSQIEDGARPQGIQFFRADPESMLPGTNRTTTSRARSSSGGPGEAPPSP